MYEAFSASFRLIYSPISFFVSCFHQELEKFNEDREMGLHVSIVSEMQWRVSFQGPSPLYTGESFSLRIRFTNEYPMESPEVIFEAPNIPIHPHIYGNGHICLNILGN